MKQLDLTLPAPAANLACDEALLDWREEEGGGDILRFWEPAENFVVVGYGNRVSTEVDVAACDEDEVPILRRCSGGGTVLQGPGCLNYALVLKIDADGPLASISGANRFIMERNRAALEPLAARMGARVWVMGHTDLALGDGRKFSGNSQRRKRRFLLFHGTFLLRLELARVGRYLRMPSLQPDYRANRSHADFLENFPSRAESVKAALGEAWGAWEPLENFPSERMKLLLGDKYVTDSWNRKSG